MIKEKEISYGLSFLWLSSAYGKQGNDNNFNNNLKPNRDILGDVKYLSYLWIKNIGKIGPFKWKQWCKFQF